MDRAWAQGKHRNLLDTLGNQRLHRAGPLALLLALALGGCPRHPGVRLHELDATPPPGPAEVELTPAEWRSGPVPVGQDAVAEFTLHNSGGTSSDLLSVVLEGNAAFRVLQDPCSGLVLEADAACVVEVGFTAGVPGEVTAELRVLEFERIPLRADLTGLAVRPARLELSPLAYDFGAVGPGMATPVPFRVTNTGGMAAGPLTTGVEGSPAFELTDNGCQGQTLEPGGECSVTVGVAADSVGPQQAELWVEDGTGARLRAALAANQSAPAFFTPMVAQHDFGTLTQGSAPGRVTLDFVNSGGWVADHVRAVPEGSPRFVIQQDFCTGMVVAPGQHCTVGVGFLPTDVGELTARLSVSNAGSAGDSVELRALVVPAGGIEPSPSAVDFGRVPRDTGSPEVAITLVNHGWVTSAPLRLHGSWHQFPLVSQDCEGVELAPGVSCGVRVLFAPQALGTFSGMLTADGEGDQLPEVRVELHGMGAQGVDLVISHPEVSLGSRDRGGMAVQPLVVTNQGAARSLPLSTQFTGAAEFTLLSDGCQGVELAPLAECTVTVRYLAAAQGESAATVRVADEAGHAVTSNLWARCAGGSAATVDPPEANLGMVSVGETVGWQTFIFRNSAGGSGGPLRLRISDEAHVKVGYDGCTNALVGPGGGCIFHLGLVGDAPANVDAMVTVESGSDILASTLVWGRVTQEVRLDALQETVDLGDSFRGDASAAVMVSLINRGSVPTGPLHVGLTTNPGNQFELQDTTCSPDGLEPGAGCNARVIFRPSLRGVSIGWLEAWSAAGGTVAIRLRARGIERAAFRFAHVQPLVVADTDVGGQQSILVEIINDGDLASPSPAVAVFFSTAFQVTQTCQGALVPGGSCWITVEFRPTWGGLHLADLQATAPGATAGRLALQGMAPWEVPVSVTLTGRGQGAVSAPGMHCTAGRCTAQYRTTGSTPLVLTATPAECSWVQQWSWPCTGTGNACDLVLDGPKDVTVELSQDPMDLDVELVSTGVPAGQVISTSVPDAAAQLACDPDCHAQFACGTQVTLTASLPECGYLAWDGPCPAWEPACTLSMTAPTRVRAYFVDGACPP